MTVETQDVKPETKLEAPAAPKTEVEEILERVQTLPEERIKQVLDFVKFIQQQNGTAKHEPEKQEEAQPAEEVKKPRISSEGIFSHLGIHITEEDIDEARREMWGNFPRDIEL